MNRQALLAFAAGGAAFSGWGEAGLAGAGGIACFTAGAGCAGDPEIGLTSGNGVTWQSFPQAEVVWQGVETERFTLQPQHGRHIPPPQPFPFSWQ